MTQWVKNSIAAAWVAVEVQVRSPCPLQWVKGSGIATAELQVAAVAWIQSLAQELPYDTGAAVKLKKKKNFFFPEKII